VLFPPNDRLIDIECTVTGTKIIEIRIPVVAGADYIKVFFLFSRGKTAGAGTVPVTLLIFQESPYKIFCEINIGVEKISPALGLFFNSQIHPVNLLFIRRGMYMASLALIPLSGFIKAIIYTAWTAKP
jgi:hypothetical protein